MLTKSTKSILRALALILAVLMTASVCLVGCTDKTAQAAADEAKTAADAAKALAQEAKEAAAANASEKSLTEGLTKAVEDAKNQAIADIQSALVDYAKTSDLEKAEADINAALAGYVKTSELATLSTQAQTLISTALKDYAKTSDLNKAIATIELAFGDYAKTSDLDALAEKTADDLAALSDDIAATLADYAKTADLTALSDKTIADIADALADYAKTADLAALSEKTTADITAALADYAKTADVEALSADIAATLADYAKTADLAALSEKTTAGITAALADYAKKADLDALAEKTTADIAAALDQAKAQATADIANALADYAKTADLTAANESIEAFSAELAKKIDAGEVYTKAEIEEKLAALGGTSSETASAAIAKALEDAKEYARSYTDAAIESSLSEDAIQKIIEKAFEDYDTVTATMVVSYSKIVADCVRIAVVTYRPQEFLEMYSHIKKYVSLNLDVEALEADYEKNGNNMNWADIELKFDAYSAVTTLLSLLRMSSTADMAAMVADFDAAAAVVAIDDKVAEMAEMILAIGTKKELTAVPADYIEVSKTDVCHIIEELPVVVSMEDQTNTNLSGYYFSAKATYKKGDLIYVPVDEDEEAFAIMRVTADMEDPSATPTDIAEYVTVSVVTVNDYAKYEALQKKVTAFIDWAAYVTGTDGDKKAVAAKWYDDDHYEVIVAAAKEDAFKVVSGKAPVVETLEFPAFGFGLGSDTDAAVGVFELICSLGTLYGEDEDIELEDKHGKDILAKLGDIKNFISSLNFTAIYDVTYVNAQNGEYGNYVYDYYYAASHAYQYAAKVLLDEVKVNAEKLITYSDLKEKYVVLDVDDLFGSEDDAEVAAGKYEDLIDALQDAIDEYKLFNLKDTKAIEIYIEYLNGAKATLKDYNHVTAQTQREYKFKKLYSEALSEFVSKMTDEYLSNEEYVNPNYEFWNAANAIINEVYFKANFVTYEVAAPTIKKIDVDAEKRIGDNAKALAEKWADEREVSATDFYYQLAQYMEETYYESVRDRIEEVYAQHCWWVRVGTETKDALETYIAKYTAKKATASDSAIPYYVSETDSDANLYYTIGQVLFGVKIDGATNTDKIYLFKAIQKELSDKIDAFMDTDPAVGTYLESCHTVQGYINDAVKKVAETYLAVVNDAELETVSDKAAGTTAKALADAQAEFDKEQNKVEQILQNIVSAGKLSSRAKALKASLKEVKPADATYPVMSLIGDDDVVAFSDLVTGKELFNYDNQYAIKLDELKDELIKNYYEAWLADYKTICYQSMSDYFYGDVGGVMSAYIQEKGRLNDAVLCIGEMQEIFKNSYTILFAFEADFIGTDTDIVLDDYAALKAYAEEYEITLTDLLNGTKEYKKGIMDGIVNKNEHLLLTYAANRESYENILEDAQDLVDAIEDVNAALAEDAEDKVGFYVAGSKFDLALTALKNVIKNAKYVVAGATSAKISSTYDVNLDSEIAYALATNTNVKYEIVDKTVYDISGLNVTHTDYLTGKVVVNYEEDEDEETATWTAYDYEDAKKYTEWCVTDAKIELLKLWLYSNPLLSGELDPTEKEAGIARYEKIVLEVAKLLDKDENDPQVFAILKYISHDN